MPLDRQTENRIALGIGLAVVLTSTFFYVIGIFRHRAAFSEQTAHMLELATTTLAPGEFRPGVGYGPHAIVGRRLGEVLLGRQRLMVVQDVYALPEVGLLLHCAPAMQSNRAHAPEDRIVTGVYLLLAELSLVQQSHYVHDLGALLDAGKLQRDVLTTVTMNDAFCVPLENERCVMPGTTFLVEQEGKAMALYTGLDEVPSALADTRVVR